MIIGRRSCSQRVSRPRKNPPARERGRGSRVAVDVVRPEVHLDGKRNCGRNKATLDRSLDGFTGETIRQSLISRFEIFIHPHGVSLSFTFPYLSKTFHVLSSALSRRMRRLHAHRSTATDLHYILRGAINGACDAHSLTVFRNRRVTRFHLAEDRS